MPLIEVPAVTPVLLCCDETRAQALRAGSLVEGRLLRALEPMRALNNPHRVRIVAALHELGELCVCDAGVICNTSTALASHHLKALHQAQIVDHRRDGKLTLYQLTEHGTRLLRTLLAEAA